MNAYTLLGSSRRNFGNSLPSNSVYNNGNGNFEEDIEDTCLHNGASGEGGKRRVRSAGAADVEAIWDVSGTNKSSTCQFNIIIQERIHFSFTYKTYSP